MNTFSEDQMADEKCAEINDNIDSDIRSKLYSDDVEQQVIAIKQIKLFIAKDLNSTLNELVYKGLIPQLVELLQKDDYPGLQWETIRIFTSLTCDNQTSYTEQVITAGALPFLVRLLESSDGSVQEEVVSVIGNIAEYSTDFRDEVMRLNPLKPMLRLLSESTRISLTRSIVWALTVLCDTTDPLEKHQTINLWLPVVAPLLSNKDSWILENVCWTLGYLTSDFEDQNQTIIISSVCPGLVRLLSHANSYVLFSALSTIRLLCGKAKEQAQVFIDCNVLPVLKQFLSHTDQSIQAESCFTISNIGCTADEPQIQALIDVNVFPIYFEILNLKLEDHKWLTRTLENMTLNASPKQMKHLVANGCINFVVHWLSKWSDTLKLSVNEIALNCLDNILRTGDVLREHSTDGGKARNECAFRVVECCGVKKIKTLTFNQNSIVQKKAKHIFDNYFGIKDKVLTKSKAIQSKRIRR